jgi:hypothetical protein
LLLARRADALGTFPLSAAMLLFPLTYYLTHTALRYRHPIDPVTTVLAVYTVSCAYSKVTARRTLEVADSRQRSVTGKARGTRKSRSRRPETAD